MIFNLQRQNLVTQLYLCSYPSTFCQRASTKLFQNSFQNAQFTIFLAVVIMTFNFWCKELLKMHVHFHGEQNDQNKSYLVSKYRWKDGHSEPPIIEVSSLCCSKLFAAIGWVGLSYMIHAEDRHRGRSAKPKTYLILHVEAHHSLSMVTWLIEQNSLIIYMILPNFKTVSTWTMIIVNVATGYFLHFAKQDFTTKASVV